MLKLKIIVYSLVLLLLTSFVDRKKEYLINDLNAIISTIDVHEECIPTMPKPVKKINVLTYDQFKLKMAFFETGNLNNPYQVTNRFGYIGKYQFGLTTLKGLVRTGYLDATSKELKLFKQDSTLQEKAMDALITHNTDILTRYGLIKYVGTKVKGTTITLEGMLAGAHLVGPYAVKHFVTTGSLSPVKVGNVTVRKFDGNGVSVLNYIKKFENV